MDMQPTIAEEHFARLIALWHGQTSLYRKDGHLVTVANASGSGTGWAWEVDRYVERNWRQYLPAARAMIEAR